MEKYDEAENEFLGLIFEGEQQKEEIRFGKRLGYNISLKCIGWRWMERMSCNEFTQKFNHLSTEGTGCDD